MENGIIRKILLLSLLWINVWICTGQSIPVGLPYYTDQLRSAQLQGAFDSTFSFALLPVNPNKMNGETGDSVRIGISTIPFQHRLYQHDSRNISLSALPVHFRTEYNSTHPWGWNNGALVRARGLQSLISPGIAGRLGMLSIQLRPEFVLCANKSYKGFPSEYSDLLWSHRYKQWNRSDLPEQFGASTYKFAGWGQSYIGLDRWGFFLGLSFENLWWGPGRHNSLSMTNNARGFGHFTLKTIQPQRTKIGSFEGQLVFGRLEASGFTPPETDRQYNGSTLYKPKTDDWRYFNAMTFTYSPPITGLSFTFTRTIQMYAEEAKERNDYFPIFLSFFKNKIPEDDHTSRDQQFVISSRYFNTSAMFEIYFEYGRNDASYNLRDLLMTPEHSRAFLFGFGKQFNLDASNRLYSIHAEYTHLELAGTGVLRPEPSWYLHGLARHGYTHHGEIIGAGFGEGGNLFTLILDRQLHTGTVGLRMDRIQQNMDFLYLAFNNREQGRRKWTDMGYGLFASQVLNRFVVDTRLQIIHSNNYQWQINTNDLNSQFYQGVNKWNVHFMINLAYVL